MRDSEGADFGLERWVLANLIGCLCLVLTACTTGQTVALIRAIDAPPFRTPTPEMQKLCDEHDGMKIYRTAENVTGYVDRTTAANVRDEGCRVDACRDALSSRQYQFVEAAASEEFFLQNPIVHTHNRTSGFLRGLVDKPGLYRFTLEKLGNPNCRIFERWHAFTYTRLAAQGKRRFDFPDTCIATWPIQHFTAKHELRNEFVDRARPYGWLHTFVNQVVDRNDGSVMAEYRRHLIKFKKQDGSVRCPHNREAYVGWDVTKVLKPAAYRQ